MEYKKKDSKIENKWQNRVDFLKMKGTKKKYQIF